MKANMGNYFLITTSGGDVEKNNMLIPEGDSLFRLFF
jgi:hypothetical protein